MKTDSILFDLDGTLWNATHTTTKFFQGRLKELGYDVVIPQPLVQSAMGMLVEEIAEVYFKDFPAEERLHMMHTANIGKADFLRAHGGILYPQVEETLALLSKKYKLFLVSNCTEEYLDAFYAAHHLERYFTDFENSGRTGMPKDHNIRLVVDRYQLQAPVYVGDIDKDRLAANAANVRFVFASYGFGQVNDYAAKVDHFADLPAVMETLEV